MLPKPEEDLKILVIEDEPQIVEAISLAFQIRWPEAKLVSTQQGEKGIELVESEKPDIVILDLGLPDINGYDVLKRIRLFSDVPILILTARTEESDIVKGLEWGADDYVVKPFKQLELLSRIKALTRRKSASDIEMPISLGPLYFNPSTGQITYNQKDISLTPTESRILHHLMRNSGQVVTHSSLADAVWGEDYPGAVDSLKVYIRRLREKLEVDPQDPQLILTKAGTGYLMVKPG
jgi:two-component system response regulator VicR